MNRMRASVVTLAAIAAAALSAHFASGADFQAGTGVAALESATAPGAPGPSAANASADALQPPTNAQKAAQRGNPLWAIPLRSLGETRARPLFSASRRPPPPKVAAAPAPAPAAPMPVIAKPAEPERPPMTLIGTIVSSGDRIAIIVEEATGSAKRLHEGDEESGWRIKTVQLRSAVVEKGDQSVTLTLPKPSDQPAPSADMPAQAPLPANDGAL